MDTKAGSTLQRCSRAAFAYEGICVGRFVQGLASGAFAFGFLISAMEVVVVLLVKTVVLVTVGSVSMADDDAAFRVLRVCRVFLVKTEVSFWIERVDV